MILALSVYTSWNERRKNAEIKYRDHLFELLSSSIDDVFLIYNLERKGVEYLSDNSRRILGLGAEDFRQDVGVLSRQMDEASVQTVQSLFSDGPLHTNAECDLAFNLLGQNRSLKVRIYPIRLSGKLQRYIVVMSDQTEAIAHHQALKDALLSAQEANAAKRNFLSRMSHEIRTPMNAIIGMTTIAASHLNERERLEDCLTKISYSSKHLLNLINDVLDMSKIEDGKLPISHERFDFQALIQSITAMAYPQAEQRGLHFELALCGITQEWLVGDALRVNQVLLNLLSNALKFTPAGGQVRLDIRQVRQRGDLVHLRFVVADTGIGMSKAYLNHLYTPFEQADASIAKKYGGTGLGLSITRNLVSMMNGTIQVESEEGHGTTFTVDLPFGLVEEDAQPRKGLENLQVLVVDDDLGTCEHAALLLKQLSICADWVQSGREAVVRVIEAQEKGEDYDVCLIDWRMPEMDGIETTRQIRSHVGADTLIIISSAYDWTPIEQAARSAGANAFIAKPFFASTLYNTLLSATNRGGRVPLPAVQPCYDFSGRRVLLAEDSPLNMEIAVELLKVSGLQVDQAVNGREAVEKFLRSAPDAYDLILMDVQMPVMNGYEATRAIRASAHPRAKTVPIVAMTANAFNEDVSAALQSGMNGHIAKPVDVDVMYKIIAPFLCGDGKKEAE